MDLGMCQLRHLDEVANGLSYYDYSFLSELPRLFCAIEDHLERLDPKAGPVAILGAGGVPLGAAAVCMLGAASPMLMLLLPPP